MMISLIVPFYNVDAYLEECLNSLINQTYRDIEIILINDGSTDNSLAIANDFLKLDNRVNVISQNNKGQSAARNCGIDIATGEYIVFVDSDDFLDINCIQECEHILTRDNLEVIFFDSIQIYEFDYKEDDNIKRRRVFSSKVKSGIQFLKEEIKKNVINYSPVMLMVKKKLLLEHNISFHEGIIHEDILFHYHLLLNANRVSYLPKTFYNRRIRENSTVTTRQGLKNVLGYKITFKVLWDKIIPNQKMNNIFYYECARRFLLILKVFLINKDKIENKKIKNELLDILNIIKGRRLIFLCYVVKTFIKIIFSSKS